MDFLKIAAIILVCVILISCIPAYDKSIIAIITIATSVIVINYLINIISPIIDILKTVLNFNSIEGFSVVIKAMGISIITQFVSDVATDSGNKTLANQMIFMGKIAIIILGLPIYIQVLEIIGQLIK